MKKIMFFMVFTFLVVNGVFAAEDLSVLGELISEYPLLTTIVIIAHICITFAVYKMKGGPWAIFYFFLAPVVIFLLLLVFSGGGGVKSNRSNRQDIHHHFH